MVQMINFLSKPVETLISFYLKSAFIIKLMIFLLLRSGGLGKVKVYLEKSPTLIPDPCKLIINA